MPLCFAMLLAVMGAHLCERRALAPGPTEEAIATLLAGVAEDCLPGPDNRAQDQPCLETIPPLSEVTASASSFQTWREKVYRPDNAFDRDFRTAWVENQKGDGIGEWLAAEFLLPAGDAAWGLVLVPGFAKNRHMFRRNNLPSRLSLLLTCGTRSTACELEPADRRRGQIFVLPERFFGAGACQLRLTVLAVRLGSHYRDTSIAEVRLVVAPGPPRPNPQKPKR